MNTAHLTYEILWTKIYRTHKLYPEIEHDTQKQGYRIIDFRPPKAFENYLTSDYRIDNDTEDFPIGSPRFILEKLPEPETLTFVEVIGATECKPGQWWAKRVGIEKEQRLMHNWNNYNWNLGDNGKVFELKRS